MRHTFQTAQWVPHPIEQVFAFFANPENLPRLMPKWQNARMDVMSYVAPPPRPGRCHHGLAAGAGSRMTVTFRPFPLSPIRMKWIALIAEFAWDDHFCDEQSYGPFAYWRHCHRVAKENHNGTIGTRIFDDLTYALPLGIFSEPAHALFVRRQIAAIFAYRRKRLTDLLR